MMNKHLIMGRTIKQRTPICIFFSKGHLMFLAFSASGMGPAFHLMCACGSLLWNTHCWGFLSPRGSKCLQGTLRYISYMLVLFNIPSHWITQIWQVPSVPEELGQQVLHCIPAGTAEDLHLLPCDNPVGCFLSEFLYKVAITLHSAIIPLRSSPLCSTQGRRHSAYLWGMSDASFFLEGWCRNILQPSRGVIRRKLDEWDLNI